MGTTLVPCQKKLCNWTISSFFFAVVVEFVYKNIVPSILFRYSGNPILKYLCKIWNKFLPCNQANKAYLGLSKGNAEFWVNLCNFICILMSAWICVKRRKKMSAKTTRNPEQLLQCHFYPPQTPKAQKKLIYTGNSGRAKSNWNRFDVGIQSSCKFHFISRARPSPARKSCRRRIEMSAARWGFRVWSSKRFCTSEPASITGGAGERRAPWGPHQSGSGGSVCSPGMQLPSLLH